MKYLNKLLLAGILTLAIPLFTSFNTNYVRIPAIKKLRQIEQEEYIPDVVDCRHKTWRYHINARMEGLKTHLVSGWINDNSGTHAYLRDEKGNIYDATWKNNLDGFPFQEGENRKDLDTYEFNATIEDYVNKKYESRDTAMVEKFKREHPNFKRRTISKEETIKRIKDYCKQDTLAWNYYQENIAKNSK